MLPSHHAVRAESVCFAYQQSDVLHDVSVELARGEVTALTGANGSGKSTLVELLAGVLAPRRGSIERSGNIALVVQRPQAPEALPVTVRDVVTMGTWARGHRLRGAATRAAVAEAIERVGLTALASRPLTSLSGGQRQRALVAQGIVRRPALLLLDEPAAGLDAHSRARTQAILAEEASRGAAVVCVTHDDDAIGAADRIVRLEHGRVVSASPSQHPEGPTE
ncbi:zinc ABC transporter ATP-binding protein AztA [Paramicrobacterium chengjingii]|uniref:Metal ABC transporter ATP-binding protein n=1 Tax=Paramicrobacterium chengjingii TaxID=2769067 RepID=A0ABX6YIL7_9MICO|nr:zinc ABC transporter ATP-binding protein AztA [Microbacterium chengjingii]QPZ38601.1 metal ABC transporter ATP-binding protein [Microbacterium chengjingii]